MRTAAVVAAVAFAVAGCGPGAGRDSSVALQAADAPPGTDGHDGADGASHGGAGGGGGNATSGPADETLRACLSRNDDVVPWREQDVSTSTGWHRQHRQAAHVRIIKQVYLRLGEQEKLPPEKHLRAGFLGYDLDPVGSRLIMMIDPTRLGHAEFERWVGGVARKANKAARVEGPRLTVTVQDGCFPAAAYEKLRARLGHDSRFSALHGGVGLDGAVHADFCGAEDIAYAEALRREVGPIFAYGEVCVRAL